MNKEFIYPLANIWSINEKEDFLLISLTFILVMVLVLCMIRVFLKILCFGKKIIYLSIGKYLKYKSKRFTLLHFVGNSVWVCPSLRLRNACKEQKHLHSLSKSVLKHVYWLSQNDFPSQSSIIPMITSKYINLDKLHNFLLFYAPSNLI